MTDKKQPNPDQIINQGLYVLCIMLGAITALIFQLAILSTLAGASIGLVAGFILSRIRPQYGEERGVWKHIYHFIVTQMDLSSAFTKNK